MTAPSFLPRKQSNDKLNCREKSVIGPCVPFLQDVAVPSYRVQTPSQYDLSIKIKIDTHPTSEGLKKYLLLCRILSMSMYSEYIDIERQATSHVIVE